MTPEELYGRLHAEPFEWFTIHLTDGTTYEVRHPESVVLGKRAAIVGVRENPSQHYHDKLVTVSLLHVVRLEPVERKAQGNGSVG